MAKINREEYNVLKSLGERWIWIARDSGDDYIGQLFVYLEKPIKSYDVGCWQDYDGGGFSSTDNYLFQFIQWSDSEPYNIAELIRGYEWAQLNEEYPPVGEREEKEVKRDKESINPERSPEVDQHKELLDEINDLYARKNQDYGGSFDDSLDEDGLLVLKIRLGDKFKRFSQLINNEQMVNDESMRDTLIDLANYALIGVMWMDSQANAGSI